MKQMFIDALFFAAFFIHVYNVFLYAVINSINWIATAFTFIILFIVIILHYKNVKKVKFLNILAKEKGVEQAYKQTIKKQKKSYFL